MDEELMRVTRRITGVTEPGSLARSPSPAARVVIPRLVLRGRGVTFPSRERNTNTSRGLISPRAHPSTWRNGAIAAALSLLALAGTAEAETKCRLPGAHTTFGGVVVGVWDGDTIYVRTATCSRMSVRIIDFRAPELSQPGGQHAKRVLSGLALNRQVSCKVAKGLYGGYRSYGRAHAICAVDGRGLGDSMRRIGVAEGGR
jgi:micrococcal nuclease